MLPETEPHSIDEAIQIGNNVVEGLEAVFVRRVEYWGPEALVELTQQQLVALGLAGEQVLSPIVNLVVGKAGGFSSEAGLSRSVFGTAVFLGLSKKLVARTVRPSAFRCSSTLPVKTGKPFAQACGSRPAASAV